MTHLGLSATRGSARVCESTWEPSRESSLIGATKRHRYLKNTLFDDMWPRREEWWSPILRPSFVTTMIPICIHGKLCCKHSMCLSYRRRWLDLLCDQQFLLALSCCNLIALLQASTASFACQWRRLGGQLKINEFVKMLMSDFDSLCMAEVWLDRVIKTALACSPLPPPPPTAFSYAEELLMRRLTWI